MPKYFKLPEPVVFKNAQPDGSFVDDVVKFSDFFSRYLLLNPKWESTVANIRIAMKIADALEKAENNGQVVVLDDAHHEMLKAAATTPSYKIWGPQGPQVHEGFVGVGARGAMKLLPFIDAIEKATDEAPKVEEAA